MLSFQLICHEYQCLMIIFEKVFLSLNKKTLVQDLSFTVKEGNHLCIEGESGIGKTSLLKLVQGYLLPDRGNIYVNGMKVKHENIKNIRQLITYLPQNINLPVKNLKELVYMVANGRNAQEILDKTSENIRRLVMDSGYINREFDQMSGGEKQRILLAFCLSLEKPILLLDEPTSSLDQSISKKVSQVIQQQSETTVLSVSHDDIWLEKCDKIITLNKKMQPFSNG